MYELPGPDVTDNHVIPRSVLIWHSQKICAHKFLYFTSTATAGRVLLLCSVTEKLSVPVSLWAFLLVGIQFRSWQGHLLRLFKQIFVIFVHYIHANICIFQIHHVDVLRILSHEYLSFLFLFQATQRHYSMCMCVCNFALQQDVSYHISTSSWLSCYQISLYYQLND